MEAHASTSRAGSRRIGSTVELHRRDIQRLPRGRRNPWRWLRFILAARRLDVVVTTGVAGAAELYDDIILPAICVRLYPRLTAVVSECLWEPGSRALNRRFKITTPPAVDAPERFALEGLIGRLLPRLDHPRMHYLVLGDDEREVFASSWRIPVDRVHFTPYWATAEMQAGRRIDPLEVDVFAGGDSLRDYRPLLAAAELIDCEVVIATRLGRPAQVPDNVRYGPLDPDTYARYAAGARVVVVCLREDAPRSSGQQTYLNAMLSGIPVIVLESLGVRDHVENGVTGVVVAHDAGELAAAIEEALSDSPAVRQRTAAAQRAARSVFTGQNYLDNILRVAEQA